MSQKLLNETSKFLSYVLRHEPHSIGLQLDPEGWADLSALIEGAAKEGRTLELATIEAVVSSNDKKRFEYSPDGLRIRAVQGHSTPEVSRQYPRKVPPEVLYHGTATRFLESIEQQGLIAGKRHLVHLSHEVETATAVGQRYGKVVVLTIDAQRMHEQGLRFYQAENGVWLTEHVPVAFIQFP
ncbi:RNA 2'-phosphotransferase [Pseudomonas gingeri]|uniref:RNA 2'-phosphotransferase n=1 Tax=Pseudomonas gingeri TaxID=117681 RepID=UPI0015A2080A|nr:RNA 2'-phosphotransferase [Pseudomonas gingeri]NVZ30060.1 RNA 2'-phosphotransferase [Pseudomonas gingeri]NWA10189.1 RNA 2'-phosphotransferase [Pseudomonas gingeri]